MKILTKTMQTVKDYDIAISAARKEFEAAKEQIFATYSNTVATEKLREASEALTAFGIKETAAARDAVKADFAEARNAISEFVSKPVPDDFPATLSAIQVKGEKITDFEAESFLKKYEGNYTAFSAILNVLNSNGKSGGVYILTPDNVNEDIAYIEGLVLNWIQNRTSDGLNSEYYSRLFTLENGNPIQKLSERIEAFLAGGFIINNSHEMK